MKKIQRFLLLLSCLLYLFPQTIMAAGDGNIDGGGGHVGEGVAGFAWPVGLEGVRLTVVDAESGLQITTPIDFSNHELSAISSTVYNFGGVSKLQYRSGSALTIQINYVNHKPETPLPKIISTNSGIADMNAIKSYFCSEGAANMLAAYTGLDAGDLVSGKYKMVIEPVIYLWYNHLLFAMTVTEAGLYNRMTGGDLGSHFPTVLMKNFALSMFLERADLGFPAWTGPKGSARSTEEMINILGIGIVSYSGAEEIPPVTETDYDQEYRVDTDVITSVRLSADQEINNESKATVTFRIDGQTYHMPDVVIPEGGSQAVWVKWHTPSIPKDVTIQISTNKGTLSSTSIKAKIISLNENPPPDPQANDRNDGYRIPPVPAKPDIAELSWGEWDCWWQSDWIYHEGDEEDSGWWCDHGWYEYDWISYSASLTSTMALKADDKNPTVEGTTMKSGYGINMNVSTRMITNAPNQDVTGVQNVTAFFPEFEYKTYWRQLERISNGYNTEFEFQRNKYSTYNQRVHFTPVWFPDGAYTVYGKTLDAWTPAGMLQIQLSDQMTVNDNLFSDWHVRPFN